MSTPRDAFAELAARVEALEGRLAEAERKSETIAAVQRVWRVLLVARGDLVLGTETGDLARVPIGVARVLAAGRALDAAVEEDEDGVHVLLVAPSGQRLARLTRAALLALPRALAAWAAESQCRGNPTALRGSALPRRASQPAQGLVSEPSPAPGTTRA